MESVGWRCFYFRQLDIITSSCKEVNYHFSVNPFMKRLSGFLLWLTSCSPAASHSTCSQVSLIKEIVSRPLLSSFILRLSFTILLSCYLRPWISAVVSLCIWQRDLFPAKINPPWLSWLYFLYCSSILWDLAALYTLLHPCRDASGTTTSVQLWMLCNKRGRELINHVGHYNCGLPFVSLFFFFFFFYTYRRKTVLWSLDEREDPSSPMCFQVWIKDCGSVSSQSVGCLDEGGGLIKWESRS